MFKKRKCQLDGCDDYFIPRSHNQKYCGEMKDKTSCAFKSARIKSSWTNKKNKERMREKRVIEGYQPKNTGFNAGEFWC